MIRRSRLDASATSKSQKGKARREAGATSNRTSFRFGGQWLEGDLLEAGAHEYSGTSRSAWNDPRMRLMIAWLLGMVAGLAAEPPNVLIIVADDCT